MRIRAALAATLLTIAEISAGADAQAALPRATNIPPQALRSALYALSRERDFQVVFRTDVVADLLTQGASGELTVEEALQRLLVGTGLTFGYVDDKTITILAEPVSTVGAGSAVSKAAAQGRDASQSAKHGVRVSQAASEQIPILRVDVSDSAEPAGILDEVVVTGSILARSASEAAIPVHVYTPAEMERTGVYSPTDFLQKQSFALTNGSKGHFGTNGEGESFVSLRGLPQRNTLFLVNGFRVAQDGVNESPNMAAIPAVALQRIEVLKGGASALYGSDAVGGVINYILKDDFTGVQLDGTDGGASQGGGQT